MIGSGELGVDDDVIHVHLHVGQRRVEASSRRRDGVPAHRWRAPVDRE